MNKLINSRYILIVILLLFWGMIDAQTYISIDPAIEQLTEDYKTKNNNRSEYNGYSILVSATRDRRKIDEQKAKFLRYYPNLNSFVKWSFEDPYYKLKVGYFQDEDRAYQFLYEVRKKFSSALEIKANFSPEELINFRRAML